jgi:hypothetical protein
MDVTRQDDRVNSIEYQLHNGMIDACTSTGVYLPNE